MKGRELSYLTFMCVKMVEAEFRLAPGVFVCPSRNLFVFINYVPQFLKQNNVSGICFLVINLTVSTEGFP